MVPDHGLLHGVEQLGPALVVLADLLVLVQRDPGPVGQEAHGIDEVEVLRGTDEGDGVARGLAAEAVVEALLGVDAEGGLFSVWKGQRPVQRRPTCLSAACSPMSATMSVAARTWATSSSGMPTADGTAALSPSCLASGG